MDTTTSTSTRKVRLSVSPEVAFLIENPGMSQTYAAVSSAQELLETSFALRELAAQLTKTAGQLTVVRPVAKKEGK